jgi:hypothetical protein
MESTATGGDNQRTKSENIPVSVEYSIVVQVVVLQDSRL